MPLRCLSFFTISERYAGDVFGVIQTVVNMTGVAGLIDARAAGTPVLRETYKREVSGTLS
jgi:hypothetical protein